MAAQICAKKGEAMTSIADLIRQPTVVDLRASIGRPLAPCGRCGGDLFNVVRRDASLRCATCDSGTLNGVRWPDPALAEFVALQVTIADGLAIEFSAAPPKPVALETLTLQACLPICPQCGCQIYDETTYSDGRVEMRCVRPGCRAEVTGEPLRIPVIRSRGYCVTASTPTADRQAMAEKFRRWQAALGIEKKN